MCATNVWTVDGAVFTDDFIAQTERLLDTAPQRAEFRMASSRVPKSSVAFTLTRNGCDCRGIIGAKSAEPGENEIPAARLVAWIHALPVFAPDISRLTVMRAWSPPSLDLTPRRARGVEVGEVDEALLRKVVDDALLTIDYPAPD